MGRNKIVISSSISNFRDKILARNIEWPTDLFIGLYHHKDYWRFINDRAAKTVFWCGSDVLNLSKSSWRVLIREVYARHLCENEIEQQALKEMGIEAEVHPAFFDDVHEFSISFTPSTTPHVWMCVHSGREEEYGIREMFDVLYWVPEITLHVYGGPVRPAPILKTPRMIYHGTVKEDIFNEEIRHYHAGIRLNTFDGASEVMFKSILLGQYPISRIKYHLVDYAPNTSTLVALLKELKNKKEPNLQARDYWLPKIENF